ncbi:glycosyltransferase family A protein [Dactylosporangium sp. NPDC051485]|uniref:glycosyltransferase family 2 protein n=1 Tax=Dactylosporangium sp. NPDC051485 TaxID=3154846 RepID=UPI003421AEEF
MTNAESPLVSIGLPVRNAGRDIEKVVKSVLSQDYPSLQLVISDNASTDDTEDVCRELARADGRIAYHRQAENIGILRNFQYAMVNADGEYFRWIGDDDTLDPFYAAKTVALFRADPRLLLVTTQISYEAPDGSVSSAEYDGTELASGDPIARLREMLRLLNASHLLIDPLYAMMRRAPVAGIPRRNMLREDEVFAAKLALAGPWRHVPEVLAHRHWKHERIGTIAGRLGVPSWQSHFSNTLQCRELLQWAGEAPGLTPDQRRQAKAAVYRMYLRRQQRTVSHKSRKLARLAIGRR